MSPELAELARAELEKAFNAALTADPATQESLSALQGKRLRLEFKGLLSLDLLPQGEHIVFAAPGLDTPDAALRASPLGWVRAKMRGDLMHGDLELLGDSHISLRFARALAAFEPDIERALSPKLGGVLAHQLGRLWHGLRQELQRLAARRRDDKADFLHDELDVTPRQSEIEPWMDAVDQLQNRLAALDARLGALEAQAQGRRS